MADRTPNRPPRLPYHSGVSHQVELQVLLLLQDADALRPEDKFLCQRSYFAGPGRGGGRGPYPGPGAAAGAARWRLKVAAPGGVGDPTDGRRGAVGAEGGHGVIALVVPGQGLDQEPVSRRADVAPEARSRRG